MLEQEIKKLGFSARKNDDDSFNVRVSIPEWDIDDVIEISEDEESYIINDGGWEDPFFKSDWNLKDAIFDHFKPIDEEEEEEDHNGVKRDNKEVYELLQNIKAVHGADELLEELSRVMSTDTMADALENVATNWGIEVNEDGTIY